MCIGSSPKMPLPTPPPPPPPPPTELASRAISTKRAKQKKTGSKPQRGTMALTRSPKMGGSYVGTGINLNT